MAALDEAAEGELVATPLGALGRPAMEYKSPLTERKLSGAEQRYLRAAGLSEAQIDAIATVGLWTDELQELLLRGIDQGAGQTGE